MDTYYSWKNTSLQEPQYWDEYSWSYEPEPKPRESLQDVAGQYNALSQSVEETSSDLVRSSEETLAATERLSRRLDDILQNLFKTPEEPPEEPRIDHVHTITTRCDDEVGLTNYDLFANGFYSFQDHSQENEVAVPPPQLEPIRARDPFRELRDDYWWSDDEDDFEPEMAIPSPRVDVSDDEDMYLEDLFGDSTREEDEMAIPFPKEDIIEDPIEAEIQAFLNAKEDGEPIPDEWQDPEEVLKELEKLLHEDPVCVSYLPVPEEKSLDDLQTMPPPCQTGKFSNFHIFEIPVCGNLVSFGLSSFLHLHNKLGLRNWKTTKKKCVFKNVLHFCLVVVSTPPLAKARNKFGKGNFDVPFDNG